MKVILLAANKPNQKALATKLNEEFEVHGIVTESRKSKKRNLKEKIDRIKEWTTFYKIQNSQGRLIKHYNTEFPTWPVVDNLMVDEINHTSVI